MAAGMLSQVNLNCKIVTADALYTVTATLSSSAAKGRPGRASMRCRPSTRLAISPRICALDAACRGRVASSARPRPVGSCGGYRDRGISMSRSGYTWLGAVRSSRADRLVTAMVSAAAKAMTVR